MTEAAPGADDKRPQVEALLTDVFKLMAYPARLDFKDLADGSLGVALHFEGELPGVTPGKRSFLVDSVQFWLNKVVNRPNVPRRWVNLGVGDFPPLRQDRPAPPPAAAPSGPPPDKGPRASAPAAAAPPAKPPTAKADKPAPRPGRGEASPQESRRGGREADERHLTPAKDPAVSALGTLLAEKAARHGRLYGVMLLPADARALVLQAADAVKGVRAKAEGEGHWRRVVFTPEKLVPLLKKQVMPDYDDDEEE